MKTYAIQVTPSGETHFLWCCQAILRKMIVANDAELADELDQLEAQAALTGDMGGTSVMLARSASSTFSDTSSTPKRRNTVAHSEEEKQKFLDDDYLDDRDPITAGLSKARRKTVAFVKGGLAKTLEGAGDVARGGVLLGKMAMLQQSETLPMVVGT